MPMQPGTLVANVQDEANSISQQAEEIFNSCYGSLTEKPDLSGTRARISLIRHSLEMIEANLAQMGL